MVLCHSWTFHSREPIFWMNKLNQITSWNDPFISQFTWALSQLWLSVQGLTEWEIGCSVIPSLNIPHSECVPWVTDSRWVAQTHHSPFLSCHEVLKWLYIIQLIQLNAHLTTSFMNSRSQFTSEQAKLSALLCSSSVSGTTPSSSGQALWGNNAQLIAHWNVQHSDHEAWVSCWVALACPSPSLSRLKVSK